MPKPEQGTLPDEAKKRKKAAAFSDQPAEQSVFAANLVLLRATGFWQRTEGLHGHHHHRPVGRRGARCSSTGGSLGQRGYFVANMACNVFFFVCKLVYTVSNTSSLRTVTENASDVLCIFFSLSQLTLLAYAEERVLRVLRQIDKHFMHLYTTLEGSRLDLIKRKAMGRRFTLTVFGLFLFTGMNFAVIQTVTGDKNLPIPIWTPFSQDPGVLPLLLLVEWIGVVLTVAGSGAVSALFFNSMLAVESQFFVVRRYFQMEAGKLPDGAWSGALRQQVRDRLVEGARLHQSVLTLAHELCLVLSPFLACQLATIIFMICIALFQVSMDPLDVRNIRFIALSLNVIAESFIICWAGTRLSEEASDVQLGVQSGDWHLQGMEIGYATKFIIMRTQKAPYIVAGDYIHVGLPAFLEIIRSSYSLLAFLQKRARKEIS